jgi:hypothetical protein
MSSATCLSHSRRNRSVMTSMRMAQNQPAQVTINQTIALMESLRDGDDIRTWSWSARKALALQCGNATLKVKTPSSDSGEKKIDCYDVFVAPKLAMVVSSPLLRKNFEQNPDKTEVNLVHPKITAKGLRAITEWMQAMCTEQATYSIPSPASGDLSEALEIRVTAQILGMDQYVCEIDRQYEVYFANWIPTLGEVEVVQACAIDAEDGLVVAVAHRLYSHVSLGFRAPDADIQGKVNVWVDVLTNEKNTLLIAAYAKVVKIREEAAKKDAQIVQVQKGKSVQADGRIKEQRRRQRRKQAKQAKQSRKAQETGEDVQAEEETVEDSRETETREAAGEGEDVTPMIQAVEKSVLPDTIVDKVCKNILWLCGKILGRVSHILYSCHSS